MKIFNEIELREVVYGLKGRVKSEINAEDKKHILNVNENEYIEYIKSKYTLEIAELNWNGLHAIDSEKNIEILDFLELRNEIRQVIHYRIPYEGNHYMFQYRPLNRLSWTTEIDVLTGAGEISFYVINMNNNLEQVKNNAEYIISNIKIQYNNLVKEINAYNNNLEKEIADLFLSRKQKLLKQSEFLANLGVPIKKSNNVPDTFSIPAPKKKTIIQKPTVPANATFKPEPTIDEKTYKDILQICHDTGIEIERHPTVYKDKDEETLRDHFLMVLSPNFQSATGETFNKEGKTDILIRHEGKNVFIAECKFWKGIKSYHKTIDQLLSYLTWRDSKAAIICFVKNKEFNPVLEQIEKGTSEHDCYIKTVGKIAEGYYQYIFHLNDDNTRSVYIAVMCFHFPE